MLSPIDGSSLPQNLNEITERTKEAKGNFGEVYKQGQEIAQGKESVDPQKMLQLQGGMNKLSQKVEEGTGKVSTLHQNFQNIIRNNK